MLARSSPNAACEPTPGTQVILLVHGLDIRVVDAITGELLREVTLDPSGDYQPTGVPRDPHEQLPNPRSWVREFPIS
ncbi:hypothetical protein EKO23_08850 [Nocardioides guangzhouensis]|uniref:Uncharacterized protein n=1 Tax=Nocardioides guangzhouensis TaxID=2497878 RepID=A0A4Q4ZHC2_9ACTN|nr:hypothetical protein EKO23_08850 [Nocardioides guangzhouensis]